MGCWWWRTKPFSLFFFRQASLLVDDIDIDIAARKGRTSYIVCKRTRPSHHSCLVSRDEYSSVPSESFPERGVVPLEFMLEGLQPNTSHTGQTILFKFSGLFRLRLGRIRRQRRLLGTKISRGLKPQHITRTHTGELESPSKHLIPLEEFAAVDRSFKYFPNPGHSVP